MFLLQKPNQVFLHKIPPRTREFIPHYKYMKKSTKLVDRLGVNVPGTISDGNIVNIDEVWSLPVLTVSNKIDK